MGSGKWKVESAKVVLGFDWEITGGPWGRLPTILFPVALHARARGEERKSEEPRRMAIHGPWWKAQNG